MIVLDLCCDKEHRFEGWFGSAGAFEAQLARHLVECPTCGSKNLQRLPSAPYVQTRHASPPQVPAPASPAEIPAAGQDTSPSAPAAAAAVVSMLRKLAHEAEDVGARLPEEARKIHYGETEARSIRGAASRDEVEELLEEGIMLMPVPPLEEDLH
ncbi:DUF1178 family protein [Thauera sinica]|uniref:DUF1178 family protein n=1 Tax=Thauera sinica TaxID=2665146 RepID=A0ABW1AL12_9RHOO|nr:DUF1178 family protein [Thauera sp. K11]ATE59837.1 hypothetical protein CCZ27_07635 [Thauera sp. K11]